MYDGLRKKLLSLVRVDEKSGCWMWQGTTVAAGYGVLYLPLKFGFRHRTVRAHRASYVAFNECPPPARGLHVMHKCDVPGCINPDHLSVGTPRQNQADAVIRGRKGRLENRTGYVGVNLIKGGQYRAAGVILGRKVYLGKYPSADAAGAAFQGARDLESSGMTAHEIVTLVKAQFMASRAPRLARYPRTPTYRGAPVVIPPEVLEWARDRLARKGLL